MPETDYLANWWDKLTDEEMEYHLNKIGKSLTNFDLFDIHEAFDNAHPDFIYPD